MSLTTEHLPSLKEEKEQLLDWLWTFLKNILIFYCECISVFVFILGPAYESLLHITISKKAMDIGRRRAGSKFKFLFFLLLGQRKWIMLKTAEGNSWKGSKWTALENRSKWYDLSVKLGSRQEKLMSFFIPKWPPPFVFVGVSLNPLPQLQTAMCTNNALKTRGSMFLGEKR